MGRKPKPTALKKLAGNPGNRPLPKDEPEPTPGRPDLPVWIKAEQREIWEFLCDRLDAMQVLTEADGLALALLVDALADYREARKKVEEEGAVFTTENGYIAQSPYVGMKNKAWLQVLTILREFGMTPSSRTALRIEKNDDESPLVKLIEAKAKARKGKA